jgi:SAM-dependent methyltransferase
MNFEHWTGVDLSEKNVDHLRSQFQDDRFTFQVGDATDAVIDGTWNLLVSSLTLKHIYPSFEPALRNLLQYSTPDAQLIFDLIEGEGRMFESNRVTYIRRYSRPELRDMLDRLGLRNVVFDTVVHTTEYPRLLVVAESKPVPADDPQPLS